MTYRPPITFEDHCLDDARLIIAQSDGWDYCGRPVAGSWAASARRLAREIRKAKGWKPPRPDLSTDRISQ